MAARGKPPLPDSIRVLGTDWRLRTDTEAKKELERQGQDGFCDPAGNQILIDPTAEVPEVVLHELVHCGEVALRFKWEESEVQAVARTFYATLRDNPALVRWLVTALES